ncbi:phosphotransferase [Actinopolymorpha singaporensis]|uniref:Phosphotransferase enzyme family protein n=1 Tax=Actinopolymorpha singaporensis TaxID=117157 RepID=A0A1H1L0W9_9ACTN|nr:phosphotransferase [Actinopolymorpha singaporensis]SDR68166.1 Phosphotransferase enzyme family protein [Actinopolymorpha singaporensis]
MSELPWPATEDRHQTTLEALLETIRLLWPAPACSRAEGPLPQDHRVVREYALLPDRRQPRLALPVGTPRVAAELFRKYSQGLSRRERYSRAAMARLAGTRLGNSAVARFAPDRLTVSVPAGRPVESIEDHLSQLLGSDVLVTVGVGPPRANRKPILRALTPDGRTLAFVKVGSSPVTTELVRGEAEALGLYWSAGPAGQLVRAPRVLHHGRWRSLELLVLEPMLPGRTRWSRPDVPTAAMAELGGRLGTTRRPLDRSLVWEGARAGPPALTDPDQAAALARIVATVERRFGSTPLTFGAWHGDWTPWNMAWDDDQVLLWDFERFAVGVPLGFDLAHYRLQSMLRSYGEAAAAERARAGLLTGGAARGSAGEAAGDCAPGDDPEAVQVVYLVELARRYAVASQPVEGTPLRARTAWLIALLRGLVDR